MPFLSCACRADGRFCHAPVVQPVVRHVVRRRLFTRTAVFVMCLSCDLSCVLSHALSCALSCALSRATGLLVSKANAPKSKVFGTKAKPPNSARGCYLTLFFESCFMNEPCLATMLCHLMRDIDARAWIVQRLFFISQMPKNRRGYTILGSREMNIYPNTMFRKLQVMKAHDF